MWRLLKKCHCWRRQASNQAAARRSMMPFLWQLSTLISKALITIKSSWSSWRTGRRTRACKSVFIIINIINSFRFTSHFLLANHRKQTSVGRSRRARLWTSGHSCISARIRSNGHAIPECQSAMQLPIKLAKKRNRCKQFWAASRMPRKLYSPAIWLAKKPPKRASSSEFNILMRFNKFNWFLIILEHISIAHHRRTWAL